MLSQRFFATFGLFGIIHGSLACGAEKNKSKSKEEETFSSSFGGGSGGSFTPSSQQDNQMSLMVENEAKRPQCSFDRESQLIYVLDLKQFQVCSNNSWAVIDALEKKPSGIGVYDANNNFIGNFISSFLGPAGETLLTIMFSNGLFGVFDWSGLFGYGVVKSDPQTVSLSNQICRFTSNDCSGTCYIAGGDVYIGILSKFLPMKNSLFFDGKSLLMTTGSEVDIGQLEIRSEYYPASNTCALATVNMYKSWHNFAVTAKAELPDGITLPLVGPLWIGPRPQ